MSHNAAKPLPSQRMAVAYLLTIAGGHLDAYTYFERGGVFANAQTGNIVKLGLALANGARDTYLSFLLPIGSFCLGLLVSLAVNEELNRRGLRLVRRLVLGIEVAVVATVAAIPQGGAWDMLANCMVSFATAMQFESFMTFSGDVIITTVSTGNLKKMVDAAFLVVARHDRAEVRRALRYASMVAVFTFGAWFGTKCCDVFGRYAALLAAALLLLAILVITHLRRRLGYAGISEPREL